MDTYIKINGTLYPATVVGRKKDSDWDGRESKTITLEMTYAEAASIFLNKTPWSIVVKDTVSAPATDAEGNLILVNGTPSITTQETEQEFDNSDFCVAGAIIDLRNGQLQIKMGKETDAEQAAKVSQSLVTLAGKPIQESEVSSLRARFENAANKLSDDDAKIAPSLTTAWNMGQQVSTGQRRYYAPDGNLYKALQDHTTSISTFPDTATDYWVKL